MLNQKPRRGTAHQGLLGGGQYLIIANTEAHLNGHLIDQRQVWRVMRLAQIDNYTTP